LNGADAAAISTITVRDKKLERVIFMASCSCMRENAPLARAGSLFPRVQYRCKYAEIHG
jgi:hypothetical protein